ncbi:hypothetical protein EES39_31180 [Streptomyces sp. ADI92-24]|nr:hypothetical protein EES39_31180 [Streptomyces sp. ADI92-24]
MIASRDSSSARTTVCGSRQLALHKAADADRRKAGKQTTVAHEKLQTTVAHEKLQSATAEHARAKGALSELLAPLPGDCTRCGHVLPEREAGLCQQCGQSCPDGDSHHERKIATARAKAEHLQQKLRRLEDALATATAAADRAEDAAAAALTSRDTYDQDHLQPTRSTAQQAEKAAHGLSWDAARLKEWLDSSDYLGKQQIIIDNAKAESEKAAAARDTALTAHEVRRKEIVGRWTELFLTRLKQINPDVETAYIDPADFTTRVKKRDNPDKTFQDSSVMGSPRAIINVAALPALRDLGRADPSVRVPPLLIIDSPLADLGAVDQATGHRLIDTLIDVASDTSADGYACHVIAATNDPPPRRCTAVREIPVSTGPRSSPAAGARPSPLSSPRSPQGHRAMPHRSAARTGRPRAPLGREHAAAQGGDGAVRERPAAAGHPLPQIVRNKISTHPGHPADQDR